MKREIEIRYGVTMATIAGEISQAEALLDACDDWRREEELVADVLALLRVQQILARSFAFEGEDRAAIEEEARIAQ